MSVRILCFTISAMKSEIDNIPTINFTRYKIKRRNVDGGKLNVEADRLAGEYQDEFGAYSPITHMYPFVTSSTQNQRDDNYK